MTVDYGTRTTVTLTGELDVICVPVLGSLLSRVAPRARELVVDVSEVTFIDCAGINALLAARRRMEARGGSLILQDVPPLVRRVLEVAGASLPVAPSAP